MPSLIVLNAFENVMPFARKLVHQFLSTGDISHLSDGHSPVLMPLPVNELYDRPDYVSDCRRLKYCDICDIELMVAQWEIHEKGARHKAAVRRRKKLADQSSQLSAN